MHVAHDVVDTSRYAKCVKVSKRVRFDIERNVVRGRTFDVSTKFLPDGLSKGNELPFLTADDFLLSGPGPHVCQHLRAGGALHRAQDLECQP